MRQDGHARPARFELGPRETDHFRQEDQIYRPSSNFRHMARIV